MKIYSGYSDLGRGLSSVAPFATGVLSVIISAAPAGLPEFSSITPLFGLGVIFFWVLVRPSLMPPAAVFSIGILQDALSGGPIGLWALTFLIVQLLTITQRAILLSNVFGRGWVGFALVTLAAAIFAWLAACIFYSALLSPVQLLVQSLLTISIYPVIAWILLRFWRLMGATA